jgi:ribosome-binding protein aMBF1 (putative translation factor)
MVSKTKQTLGEVVTAARSAKFWTQVELARRARVSAGLIARIEREHVLTVTPRIASKLGQKKALDTNLSEFTNK